MKIKLRTLLTEVTRREATNFDRGSRFNQNTSNFLNELPPFKGANERKNNDIRDNFDPSKLDTNILKTRDGISKIAGDIGYNPIKSALLGLGSGYILLPDLEESSTRLPKIQVNENLGFGAPSGVATGTNTPTNSSNNTNSNPKKIILRDKPLFGNKSSKKNINENYVPNLEVISKNFDHSNLNKVDQRVKDYASNFGIDINGMNLHTYLPEKQMEIVKNKQMGIK